MPLGEQQPGLHVHGPLQKVCAAKLAAASPPMRACCAWLLSWRVGGSAESWFWAAWVTWGGEWAGMPLFEQQPLLHMQGSWASGRGDIRQLTSCVASLAAGADLKP